MSAKLPYDRGYSNWEPKFPFDVVHVDAHPDFAIEGVLRLSSGYLSVEKRQNVFNIENLNSGNYLTLAIVNGWLSSLLWVKLDAARMPSLMETKSYGAGEIKKLPNRAAEAAFGCVECSKYWAIEKFDYMVLSKSPEFTPVKSDFLVPVIEEYMEMI